MVTGAQQLYVKLFRKGKPFVFLIDTGASISLIKHSAIGTQSQLNSEDKIKVIGIAGTPFSTLGSIDLKFNSKNFHFYINLQVLPELTSLKADGILGSDFFNRFNADICFSTSEIVLNTSNARLDIFKTNTVTRTLPPSSLCYVEIFTSHTDTVCINIKELAKDVYLIGCIQKPRDNTLTLAFENNTFHPYEINNLIIDIEAFNESAYTVNTINKNDSSSTTLTFSQYENNEPVESIIQNILQKYNDLIADAANSQAKLPEQKIYLKPHVTPRYVKQYRLPPNYRNIISTKVEFSRLTCS